MKYWNLIVGPDASDHISWAQESARGIIMFAVGIALMRLSGKRTFSRGSPLDIVVTVMIGSNLSRALTGNSPMIATIVASAIFVLLHRLLAKVCQRWPSLDPIIKGRPVPLIENGAIITSAISAQAMTEGDLLEAIRTKSADNPQQVRLAILENSGQISVLKRSE